MPNSETDASTVNAAQFAPHQDDVFGRIAHRDDLLCDFQAPVAGIVAIHTARKPAA